MFFFFYKSKNNSMKKSRARKYRWLTIMDCHSFTEHCPQASSENYWIPHNNHYETMMWPSWRLQGCKEVGPFGDTVIGGTAGKRQNADTFECQSMGAPQGRRNYLLPLIHSVKK